MRDDFGSPARKPSSLPNALLDSPSQEATADLSHSSSPRQACPILARGDRPLRQGPQMPEGPALLRVRRERLFQCLEAGDLGCLFIFFLKDITAPRQRGLSRKVVSGKGLKQRLEK